MSRTVIIYSCLLCRSHSARPSSFIAWLEDCTQRHAVGSHSAAWWRLCYCWRLQGMSVCISLFSMCLCPKFGHFLVKNFVPKSLFVYEILVFIRILVSRTLQCCVRCGVVTVDLLHFLAGCHANNKTYMIKTLTLNTVTLTAVKIILN